MRRNSSAFIVPQLKRAVELRVRQDPIFIYLDQRKYGKNKGWRQQVFRVSGEWECPADTVLLDTQRVPRDWRPLVDDLRILPKLSVPKIKEVNEMLSFSIRSVWETIDFENLVSVQSLNNCFGYQLPENKVALDKKGVPIPGWILTTGRPIPGNAPKKVTRKGAIQSGTSGGFSEFPSRKTRASKILERAAATLQSSETTSEVQEEESSADSDDTIMREIDEVARASTEGGDEESSPTAILLPSDPNKGASPCARNPRSPPPSFEEFVKEDVIATLAEGVRDPLTFQPPLESLPMPELNPVFQHESILPKCKGKEVISSVDEIPASKKLRADGDSDSMISRILVMAKAFAPSKLQIPSALIPPPIHDSPPHSQALCTHSRKTLNFFSQRGRPPQFLN